MLLEGIKSFSTLFFTLNTLYALYTLFPIFMKANKSIEYHYIQNRPLLGENEVLQLHYISAFGFSFT